eukprot:SAG11_NODE_247_length_11679_cov_6.170898_1_plen_43_part_00
MLPKALFLGANQPTAMDEIRFAHPTNAHICTAWMSGDDPIIL